MPAGNDHFKDRLVLVTGGSSGIGLALAKQLTRAGARVWILGRRTSVLEDALGDVAAAAGSRPRMLACDVADWEQTQAAMDRMQKEVGAPDLVINSAGVTHPGYVEELPLKIFREMMEINYLGTVHVVKALLPAMLARGSGHIVNVSSSAGFLGVFGYSAYGASKYAVRGFSDVLRAEMKPRGLKVSVVFPPDTDTPQLAYENQFKPAETKVLNSSAGLLSPDSVATSILKGVRRGHYVIIPGLENSVLYWLSGLLGTGVYPIMDMMVADARRKAGKK